MSATAIPSSDTPKVKTRALASAVAAAFAPVSGLTEAEVCVRKMALGHYENFSVVSHLVPRAIRQDFYNIYGFCRTADDFGDEAGDRDTSLRHLAQLRDGLNDCYAGRPAGAVFVALASTIARFDIPIEPFADLISAFEQDQRVQQYATFEELVDYCRRSANPVGRLVLYVTGYRDAHRQQLADHTCTALQLTNFWQDVRRDMDHLQRIYIPMEWMNRFGVTPSDLKSTAAGVNFKTMMRFCVDQAEALFVEGDALLPTLSRPVAAHVALFAQGSRAILEAIRDQDYDTLSHRPTLSKWKKTGLVSRAVAARLMTLMSGATHSAGSHA